MKKCVKCGQLLEDTAIICPNCATLQTEGMFRDTRQAGPQGADGTPPTQQPFDPLGGGQPARRRPPGALGYLIWSIILMLLGCGFVGLPSLIFTVMAYSAGDYNKASEQIRFARITCVIETVVFVIIIIVDVVIQLFFPNLYKAATSAALQ
ncbi:MAG: CD225/dispanin family protein [Clostridia bacterium]|nr:CD225/dispanin family protein [Clostridia bacterium]